MLTAYAMRELNTQLKLRLAEKTSKDIQLGRCSPDVKEALDYISKWTARRTSEERLPYHANSFSINASVALGKQDHYQELMSTLRNLGYTVSTSHSTHWGNEQLTISW